MSSNQAFLFSCITLYPSAHACSFFSYTSLAVLSHSFLSAKNFLSASFHFSILSLNTFSKLFSQFSLDNSISSPETPSIVLSKSLNNSVIAWSVSVFTSFAVSLAITSAASLALSFFVDFVSYNNSDII